ncbi:MAG TPA: S9 family peptidase [Acidimicrobiia bacterium]|nr:S9 family peptidase [Acidimicrobiia bacterium]
MTELRPITAAMLARSHGVGEPRWSPAGAALAWLDSWNGRTDIVVAPADGSEAPRVITADFAVTPAGAYGGGGYCWVTDDLLAVAGANGHLAIVDANGGVVRVVSDRGAAFAPAASPDGTRVAFSLETDAACDIAVVPVDGEQWPRKLSQRADYAWDADWSADGRTLAWHEWDLDEMSWDASRIAMKAVDGEGAPAIVAGGHDEGVGQPRFSPDGAHLAFVSDRGDVARIWVARATGREPRLLHDEPHEHAGPAWGPGQRTYAWAPDGTAIAYCRNEQGFGRLVVKTTDDRSEPKELGKAWHSGIGWNAHRGIVAVRAGARTPSTVVVVDPQTGERRAVARGPVGGFEAAGLVEPEAVEWKSGRATVRGLLYRPERSALAPRQPPPLYVHIHGGPTSQVEAGWNPRIAYWVSRGWVVLAPNYRGSTGYGREYAQGLREEWGVVDVADTAAGIRHAIKEAWCDPHRVAVVGGSAGGMTVLLLCALHGDVVRAGVSLFGVTDLFELARTTHRFESRYLDALIGKLPATADRYRDRSPITHAHEITVPVLVLQGDEDKAVPKAQADAMVDAMRRAGAPVEYHVYAGEGHGFRKLENVIDEIDRTEAFLTKWVLAR